MPQQKYLLRHILYSILVRSINRKQLQPMDKNFTQDFKLTDSLLTLALESDKKRSPSETSLAFIRNFARNFKINRCDGCAHEFVLN